MASAFSITVSFHIRHAHVTYGKFVIVADRKAAIETFQRLKGKQENSGNCVIRVELTEETESLVIALQTIFCNLEQLKENIGIISKEIFRLVQLEENEITPLL